MTVTGLAKMGKQLLVADSLNLALELLKKAVRYFYNRAYRGGSPGGGNGLDNSNFHRITPSKSASVKVGISENSASSISVSLSV